MKRDNDRQASIVLAVIGIPLVIWLALLIAPSVKGGLPEILPKLLTVFNDPYASGITQNVDDLLQSHTARTMLANSEFIIMLNQASTDRLELAKLLNISDLQMSYITNVGAGQGLLKVGSSLVPFVNKFPRNTELYKLMTTKFGEV